MVDAIPMCLIQADPRGRDAGSRGAWEAGNGRERPPGSRLHRTGCPVGLSPFLSHGRAHPGTVHPRKSLASEG